MPSQTQSVAPLGPTIALGGGLRYSGRGLTQETAMESTEKPSPQEPAAPSEAPKPLLDGEPALRVKRYARMLASFGVAAGAFIVAGAALIRRAMTTGERQDYLVGGVLVIFGVIQGVNLFVRYRQLARYLRTGSGSKYEDLILAAGKPRRGPDS